MAGVSGSGDQERAQEDAEQAAWQAIVDNYGERAVLDDATTEPESPTEPEPAPPAAPPPPRELWPSYDESRFVPPTPPPLPRPEPKRAAAWAGLFGVPIIVLLALVLRLDLPTAVDYLLLVWWVGGFGYLVATMPRSPREPWDDGSRV